MATFTNFQTQTFAKEKLSMEVFIKNIKNHSKTLGYHLSGNPLVIYCNFVDSTSIHIFSLNPIQIAYKL